MRKHLISVILFLIIIIPFKVHAEDFVTESGFIIPESDYNNFRKIFSEGRIYFWTEDDYDYYMDMNIDFENLNKTVKYIRTDYNEITGESIDTVLTREQFLYQVNAQKHQNQSKATIIRTGYKEQSLVFHRTSPGVALFDLSLVWFIMPAVRSYDVIGARFHNCEAIDGTQEGFQTYKLNGTYQTIEYHWNGTNINREDIGFGISMNLVNSNITELTNEITAVIDVTGSPASAYASYQHAVRDISLANSKDYTLGNGVGNVFVFNNGYGSYYDGMQGTDTYFY